MNKKYYLFFGIILVVLALLSVGVFSEPIDQINVSFEKNSYSMMDDDTLKINFTIENNNSTSQEVLVYTFCDEDELECDFSKVFTFNQFSSIDSSFIIKSLDDGSSDVTFFVKDMKTNSIRDYSLRIDVDDDSEDGKFEVDLSRTSYCNNNAQEVILTFEDVSMNDFYNLSLSSDTIIANIKGGNNRYLKDDVEIPIQIETFNASTGSHLITLTISNDEITSKKTFNVYVSDCQEVLTPDFTVVGVQSTTHLLTKGEEYTLDFTIKNTSNKNKHIFISQESDNSLEISFSNREVKLAPYELKEVSITFLATQEISSGDYPVELSFFDERTTTTRNLRFLVQPESNLEIRLLQSSFLLEIGKSYNITAVVENKGDVLETIYFDFISSNDIKINDMSERVTLSPNTTMTVVFNVSAGRNTVEKSSQIELIASNQSNFSERFVLNVTSFRQKDIFKIEFLSFPKELSVDVNGSKDFSFEIYNFDDKDITISRIDIVGLPQEISYEIDQYTYIPKKSSRVISGKIISGDIPAQEYEISFVFYSNSGAVTSKPVTLKVKDALVKYDDDDVNPITGFFTLSKSILLGIIFLALLLIILFTTGVIKTKHKSSVRS
ncbi:hypothetical protein GW835_01245 [archaeon]|nr:hypothetical protein [archaeon]NCP79177.1 hypothetical protein [archaeon]NCP97876.1 hypothetical protein [archaeon]NCQ06944.1 hypothetical protein [archaeon]NCQ50740.1 hypothetical protein [archaeon]